MPHGQRGRLRLLVSMAPGLGPGQTCLHLSHPYLCIFIYVNYPQCIIYNLAALVPPACK